MPLSALAVKMNISTIPLDMIGMRRNQLLNQVGWSYRAFLEATPGIGSLTGSAPGAAFTNDDGGHHAGAAAHLRRAAAADAAAMDGDALVLGGALHRYQVPSSALCTSARRHFRRTAPETYISPAAGQVRACTLR